MHLCIPGPYDNLALFGVLACADSSTGPADERTEPGEMRSCDRDEAPPPMHLGDYPHGAYWTAERRPPAHEDGPPTTRSAVPSFA